MFDDLIRRGLSLTRLNADQARNGLRIVTDEMRAIGSDMLGAAVESQIRNQVRGQLLATRNELLKNIADVPPTGFAQRLRLRGYENATDAQIQNLWADLIASIAEQPATSPAEDAAVAV